MALVPGARLGSYEIVSLAGAGGMGEVYRAHDTKLNRDVALKVLPESFAWTLTGLARFKREAQVLASLNHPQHRRDTRSRRSAGVTCAGIGAGGGPTLADRIAQGPMPIDEALPIAKQIAEALEAAHERGIIHRDLKPANIKITPAGVMKVLDFGLAKAASGDGSGADLTQSPTSDGGRHARRDDPRHGRLHESRAGAGKPVDKRTDIWAFGCVLYEMLTGRRAFGGDTISDTIAAILEREPEWRCAAGRDSRRAFTDCCDVAWRRIRSAGCMTSLMVGLS